MCTRKTRPTCLSISWMRWLVKCFPSCWWSIFPIMILLQHSNSRLKKRSLGSRLERSLFLNQPLLLCHRCIANCSLFMRNYQLFCHNLSLQIVLSQWLQLCVTYFATILHCKLFSSQFTWVVRQLFCLKRVVPEREASASGFPRRLASDKAS